MVTVERRKDGRWWGVCVRAAVCAYNTEKSSLPVGEFMRGVIRPKKGKKPG